MRQAILLLLIIWPCLSIAQVFDVETIVENGDVDKRINLIVLSDGYQASELDQFVADATSFSNELFSQTPYAEYADYFNVYAIKVPSNESGATHPGTATDVPEPVHPVITVDNYFGSSFDVANIHRLVVPLNTSAIVNVLAQNFPQYDQVVMLVNSPYYGGSGGAYATTTLEASANEIAIHEMGHSFADLRDEYWAGNPFAQESINMTQETDPTLVRWRNWLNDNGVGIYQHCCGGNSSSWYRPHESCKMRVLGPPFCSVCTEGTIERIHSLVSPIDSYVPDNGTAVDINVSDLPFQFQLNLIEPTPANTLAVEWLLNGAIVANDTPFIIADVGDFVDGANTLRASVEDQTSLLRVDNHSSIHLYVVEWDIEYDPVLGITDIESDSYNLDFSIAPNPALDRVEVLLETQKAATYKVELTATDGKMITSKEITPMAAAGIEVSALPTGVYFMNLYQDGAKVASKKLIKE